MYAIKNLAIVWRDFLFFSFIFDNIANVAIEDKTKLIQRFCGDSLPVLDAVECVCRDALFEYEVIFRDILV